KALFDQENKLTGKDELRIYDAASDTSQPIAADVRGVAGQGEDLSRVYFVSDEALPGAGANSPWGEEAVAGQPNLYLWEEGEGEGEAEVSFVATLLESDTGKLEPGTDQEAYIIGNPGTYSRGTRASADGSALAFNSRAPLTDFDNTEPASGKPAVEVYRYDAQAGELACVSCNPSGARPRGRELREAYTRPAEDHPTKVIAAAWIRGWEHPLHASRLLSADGERLFFNARDALLPRDTNGADDVYQWEAPGSGSCSTASPSYFPQSGGCLDLISSGKSPTNSEFMEASPDGADVFFTTEAGLLPQDPGSVDLYDARVGGGFPQPVPAPQCAGEACQVAPPPPDDPTPASASFRGPGDPAPVKARGRRCPKGKRAVRRNGSRRCVKPKVRGNKRRANAKGRTGR
ncbi:MAG TPA: hypothetical protein VF729_06510, partial [Solirubrobacterales bacterium]